MQKPWLKHYPKGIPETIDTNEYSSLVDFFDRTVNKYANLPAYYNMGTTLTYEDLSIYVNQFASYLQNDLGLKKGDRVAIMSPNLLQYPVALFGILKAGCVVVNVNPLYTARELTHQLNDSGAETIVIVENFASTLEESLPDVNIKNIVLTSLGDMHGFPKRLLLNAVVKYVKKMVPAYNLPNVVWFREALTKGATSDYKPVTVSQEDIAFLQYTGGTTGVSKGAMLTHKNMVSNIIQARTWISPLIKDGVEKIITALPLYHIFSLTANCMTFMAVGGLNILITNPRDIPGFVKELSKHNFTAFTAVNTLFNALLNNPDFGKLDFSHFKLALGGGMAVQKAVADRWQEVTGAPLSQAYGLTETSPAACINPIDAKEFNGTIGLPISSTIVSIKDEDGNDLPFGEIGELCVQGPQVMAGYWNRPEETKKTMTADGFLKTGDIATMAEDGFVKIVDRKKDMILVSGFNVYPNEVEDVVATHPEVLEVAAVGKPDDKSGEVVKLYVVKKEAGLTEEKLIEFCRENMTGYKVPKEVEFKDELPKTNVGKILRRALREAQ